jgi:hypothetical protein
MLDDFDFEDFDESEPEGLPPEEGDNRTFLLVAGGLGVLVVLTLIIMAVYAFFILPNRGGGDADANATIAAQNEQIAQSLTETAIAGAFSPTPSNTAAPTNTPAPTDTPAVIFSPTPGGTDVGIGPTADPRTATVEALLTQAAVAQTQAASSILTVTPTPTPVSSLPDTGLLDDLGTTGLIGLTAILLVVIFAARRLRSVNS